jgi:membrane-bound lytic murein transglycosylase MltF
MRAKHPKHLYELTWNNVYERPDLQIRALVLKMRDNYQAFAPYSHSSMDALAFADAAYNGGVGGVNKERRACKLSSTCDPSKWFGNVELFCMKSTTVLYGARSACDINRHHVQDVLLKRSARYATYF